MRRDPEQDQARWRDYLAVQGLELIDFDGRAVRRAREARGMSLEELAVALGRSASQVEKYERGESLPTLAVLGAIAQIVQTPVDGFFRPVAVSHG